MLLYTSIPATQTPVHHKVSLLWQPEVVQRVYRCRSFIQTHPTPTPQTTTHQPHGVPDVGLWDFSLHVLFSKGVHDGGQVELRHHNCASV